MDTPTNTKLLSGVRFATIMLTALTLGLAFAHALEAPVKLDYPSSLYVHVNHSLYAYFLYVGAPIQVGALGSAILLTVLLRHRAGFACTIGAATVLTVALAVFFAVVYPANVEFASWTPTDVPADWHSWRARWEYGHMTGAALQFLALTLLLLPMLRTAPATAPRQASTRADSYRMC